MAPDSIRDGEGMFTETTLGRWMRDRWRADVKEKLTPLSGEELRAKLRRDPFKESCEQMQRARELGVSEELGKAYANSLSPDSCDPYHDEEAYKTLIARLPGPLSEDDRWFVKLHLDAAYDLR